MGVFCCFLAKIYIVSSLLYRNMARIIQEIQGSWLFLINQDAVRNKAEVDEQMALENHGSLGKYIFFSDSQSSLIQLALTILEDYDLYHAKISISANHDKPGYDFVCCVYDASPRFLDELEKFGDEYYIRYRRWKSDAATLAGEYSKHFQKVSSFS